jgi:protein-tyrosine phosphatase
VKQPGRDSERHEALQKNCLSNWKRICFQLWQLSIIAVIADKPMNILFYCFGGINRSAAVLCAWLIVAYDYSAEDAIKLLLTKRPSLCPRRHRDYVLDALWMVEQQRSEWYRDFQRGAA